MKMLSREDYEKINDMRINGNKDAGDFLMNFMNMDDEEANKALGDLIGRPDEVDPDGTLSALIADEAEAIDGYDKAIQLYKTTGRDAKLLEKIRDEEYTHIKWLQEEKKKR